MISFQFLHTYGRCQLNLETQTTILAKKVVALLFLIQKKGLVKKFFCALFGLNHNQFTDGGPGVGDMRGLMKGSAFLFGGIYCKCGMAEVKATPSFAPLGVAGQQRLLAAALCGEGGLCGVLRQDQQAGGGTTPTDGQRVHAQRSATCGGGRGVHRYTADPHRLDPPN